MKASKRKTLFVVQTFSAGTDGPVPDRPQEVPNETTAMRRAERLAVSKVGVIAFSRTCDPELGEFDEAVIIAKFGSIPFDAVDPFGP